MFLFLSSQIHQKLVWKDSKVHYQEQLYRITFYEYVSDNIL